MTNALLHSSCCAAGCGWALHPLHHEDSAFTDTDISCSISSLSSSPCLSEDCGYSTTNEAIYCVAPLQPRRTEPAHLPAMSPTTATVYLSTSTSISPARSGTRSSKFGESVTWRMAHPASYHNYYWTFSGNPHRQIHGLQPPATKKLYLETCLPILPSPLPHDNSKLS